jgi:hypothetical protein
MVLLKFPIGSTGLSFYSFVTVYFYFCAVATSQERKRFSEEIQHRSPPRTRDAGQSAQGL